MLKRIIAGTSVASLLVSAALAASPGTPTPPGTAQSVTDTLLQAGTAKIQTAIWWNEAQAQTIAANASITGTSRANAASGAGQQFGYFTASVYSTVAGTLALTNGNGASSSYTVSVVAGTPSSIKIPAFGSQFTAVFTAGGTGGTVTLYDGFTVN